MSDYVIEKNIPIGFKSFQLIMLFPLKEMEVRDSIYHKVEKTYHNTWGQKKDEINESATEHEVREIKDHLRLYGRKHEKKFTSRITWERDEMGLRIWRTE